MSEKVLCIYHANCSDGFAAAWVVRRALGDAVEFHAADYDDPPPDVTDRRVVIVDFSYKRPVLLEMAEKAYSILILDHHKSAVEDLRDLPVSKNVLAKFDMHHSGAMLAWDHFFPDPTNEPPILLLHIQDRDLFRFELPHTDEIMSAVFSYPYNFDVWDELMAIDVSRLRAEGIPINRKTHKDTLDLIQTCRRRMSIGGHDVPVASMPHAMASNAGHMMAIGEPFAAVYWDTKNGRYFSLRSSPDGMDVSAVAATFGGGGHRGAAGFSVPRDHPLARA